MAREYGQITEVTCVQTINRETYESGTAWELRVYRPGKGPGERNLLWGGLYRSAEDCYLELAGWAKEGFPDPSEDA